MDPKRSRLGDRGDFPEWMDEVTSALERRRRLAPPAPARRGPLKRLIERLGQSGRRGSVLV